MGISRIHNRGFPSWTKTLGSMWEQARDRPDRAWVKCWCDKCKQGKVLDRDLPAMIEAKGAGYSLVNRRRRCREPQCSGHVHVFYYGGMMRPLWDRETNERWMFGDN